MIKDVAIHTTLPPSVKTKLEDMGGGVLKKGIIRYVELAERQVRDTTDLTRLVALELLRSTTKPKQ